MLGGECGYVDQSRHRSNANGAILLALSASVPQIKSTKGSTSE